ncbi:MAG: hypothetical protein H7841_10835 [Magnetospirillum sp. WYHS-4]
MKDGLSLHRGFTDWSLCLPPEDPRFLDEPLICVDTASDLDWRLRREEKFQSWLYFHDRASWRIAHRLARLMAAGGGRATVVQRREAVDLPFMIIADRHSLTIQQAVPWSPEAPFPRARSPHGRRRVG